MADFTGKTVIVNGQAPESGAAKVGRFMRNGASVVPCRSPRRVAQTDGD